jgi:hypothetical protein
MYRQGLKDIVKRELMRSGAALDDLNNLIEESICINNNLYKLALEVRAKRHPQDNKTPKQLFYPNIGQYQAAPQNYRNHRIYSTMGYKLMHLDNLNKGKP